jgi:hypothetical protein
LTGFDTGEIDLILGGDTADEPDTVPLPDLEKPAVSREGDLWLIGRYRLYVGSALEADS